MSSLLALAICCLVFCSSSLAATRKFSINVTLATRAPDGFSRPQILVNGQSPGPALIVDQGDDVEFLVCNELEQPTAVHFHGIEQLNTPWSDGVPGLSQKPIPPGGEFLYKWNANEYGTYFYHAHYQGQISDGLFGPIYIRGRSSQSRPFNTITSDPRALAAITRAEDDPQFVTISDWSHATSEEYIQLEQESNLDLYCTNSILFNGKGRVECLTKEQQHQQLAPPFQAFFQGPLKGQWLSDNGCLPFAPFSQGNFSLKPDAVPDLITGCQATNNPLQDFKVDPRKQWVSFQFIGATALQAPIISIDEHPLWVYAIDGRYIVPTQVDGFQLFNGDRYSVMVQLDKRPGQYTMRANNLGANQLISGFATMTYGRENDDGTGGNHHGHWKRTKSTPYFTYGGFPVSPNVTQLNETLIVPFENEPPAREVDQTHILRISRFGAPWVWTLDGDQSYPMRPKEYAEDQPLLYNPESMNAQNGDLVIRTQNDTWVDIVFVVVDTFGPPHPMHKHSNKAYVIGSGTGSWNWSTVAEAAAAQPQFFNFDTPQLRDGYTTPPAAGTQTWLAIRYHVVNPGAFMLHCHIQPHLSGGMAVAILDGVDALPQIPAEYGAKGDGNGT